MPRTFCTAGHFPTSYFNLLNNTVVNSICRLGNQNIERLNEWFSPSFTNSDWQRQTDLKLLCLLSLTVFFCSSHLPSLHLPRFDLQIRHFPSQWLHQRAWVRIRGQSFLTICYHSSLLNPVPISKRFFEACWECGDSSSSLGPHKLSNETLSETFFSLESKGFGWNSAGLKNSTETCLYHFILFLAMTWSTDVRPGVCLVFPEPRATLMVKWDTLRDNLVEWP